MRANVVALTVELGRVVDGKEHFKEGLKRNNGGVKLDLDHFGVPGCAAANGFVSRVRVVAPSVGRECRFDPFDLLISALHAPEASATNDHSLHSRTGSVVSFEGLIQTLGPIFPRCDCLIVQDHDTDDIRCLVFTLEYVHCTSMKIEFTFTIHSVEINQKRSGVL